MAKRSGGKLNWIEHNLPEGLLVDAAWLSRNGYSSSLRSQYVAAGWLEQPARGVFCRPRGVVRWEQAVISLQTLLGFPAVVGGRTALELQGYAHYPPRVATEVHLYASASLPLWLNRLPLKTRFLLHRNRRLFPRDPPTRGLASLEGSAPALDPLGRTSKDASLVAQPWGQFDWLLGLSAPERAVLELLDELPDRESFHQVDKLVEGLANLSPRRLQEQLEGCGSVKVKRLFFFFADRHPHAWLQRIDRRRVDLGKGKRLLSRGGKLDPTYAITVPADLDAVS